MSVQVSAAACCTEAQLQHRKNYLFKWCVCVCVCVHAHRNGVSLPKAEGAFRPRFFTSRSPNSTLSLCILWPTVSTLCP